MWRRTSRAAGAIGVALSALVVLSCGPAAGDRNGGAPADAAFTVTDSAGVAVTVTEGSAARQPLGWRVDSVPDLVIGTGDDPGDQLDDVRGVRALPGGGVLVLDGGSRELRFFNAEGHFDHRVGGKGRGPGEFDYPELVPAAGTDSVMVWDRMLRRLQVFSADGRGVRSVPRADPPQVGFAMGAVGLHVLFEVPPVIRFEDYQKEGAHVQTVRYVWRDVAEGATTPVDTVVTRQTFTFITPGHPSSTRGIPFTVRPSAAVWSGSAVVTDGVHPVLLTYDLQGRLTRVSRIDEREPPVGHDAVEAQIGRDAARQQAPRARIEDQYAKMSLPDTMPAFQDLVVDREGWLWAERYDPDTSTDRRWVVFDPDGRARGTVETPAGIDVRAVGRDYILGVATDDLGVETVRRFGLHGRADPRGDAPAER